MTFQRLDAENVRCLVNVAWTPGEGLNVIVGPNGAGKTSVLEAVSLVATGRVMRAGGSVAARRRGSERLRVTAEYGKGLEKTVVGYESGPDGRVWAMDGQPQRSALAIVERVPVMVLTPDAHHVALQDPAARRAATHWALFHVEPLFLDMWRRYQRILRQRNAALRQGDGVYRMFDHGLAQVGESLAGLWVRLYASVSPLFTQYAERLGLEGLATVRMRSPWEGSSLEEALRAGQATDERLGYTQLGAHRLDLKFFLDEHPLQTVGSHGQQKVIISAWRLALAQRVARSGKTPTLLVDDVPAELDRVRRAAFFTVLQDCGAQAMATATEDPPSLPAGTEVFHVEQGRFPT
ncbi:MAG: DNA replication and repair protein RecF [Gammaproteobacteria bacterium]|nr:DNA replication and repair protein RecF [Gammaproteobacteria bacterium]